MKLLLDLQEIQNLISDGLWDESAAAGLGHLPPAHRRVTHRIAHRDCEAVRATAERDGTETHALLVAQDQRAALRVYAQTTFEGGPRAEAGPHDVLDQPPSP